MAAMGQSRNALVTIAAGALVVLATACGSGSDQSGSVPGISDQGIAAQDFSCIGTKHAKSTSLSRALASTCGCASQAVHVDGTPSNIDAVDCSGATLACVNGVLDTNGYRSPPWSASTTAYPPCSSLAVSYDPCGGTCRVGGPVSDGGTDDDNGDEDGDEDNEGHHHHHGH